MPFFIHIYTYIYYILYRERYIERETHIYLHTHTCIWIQFGQFQSLYQQMPASLSFVNLCGAGPDTDLTLKPKPYTLHPFVNLCEAGPDTVLFLYLSAC